MATPILLVEDNEDEVLLLRRALKLAGSTAPMIVVHDGLEAIDYLTLRGPYRDRTQHPLPHVMVVDLKLPRLSGLGLLKWLREQPGLRRLPVVILTSSSEERDVASAYDMGANSYVLKPSGIASLQQIAEMIHRYWLGTNVRPSVETS